MTKKTYNVSWVVLLGDNLKNHEQRTVEFQEEFSSAEEALEWARQRLTIEVQECDDQGRLIGLINDENYPVEWDFWSPEKS